MFPAMRCKLLVHSYQNGEHVQHWGFYNCSIWNKFVNLTVSYLKSTVCEAVIEIGSYDAAKFKQQINSKIWRDTFEHSAGKRQLMW